MITLLSTAAPEPDPQNETEVSQHAAFLLLWQILGVVVPAVVLFSVLKEMFGVLSARYNRAPSRRGRQPQVTSQVVEKQKQPEKNGRKTKTTNEDGRVRLWVLVNSESESDNVSAIGSDEEDEAPPRRLATLRSKISAMSKITLSTSHGGGAESRTRTDKEALKEPDEVVGFSARSVEGTESPSKASE